MERGYKIGDCMKVVFVTHNKNKLAEARHILGKLGIKVSLPAKEEKIEIQSERLEEIVEYALSQIEPVKGSCFVVEDDGLFIDALNGFPGPYSAYAFKTIGREGILKLMQDIPNRRASFKSVVGALLPEGSKRLFVGKAEGQIAYKAAKGRPFGFDPIFVPKGRSRTFAEMSIEEKSKLSHRGKAFLKLGMFLKHIADV